MKIFNIYSPTTVSLKTWLILGFVETWHSKSPASEAFVNLSLRVFWPRLRLIHVLFQTFSENITSLPSRHKVKALITNVFLFSYIEWVTIICTHPRHLKEKVMGMLTVISRFTDFWKDFAKTLQWWWSILILCRGALCAQPKLHNFILFTIYKQWTLNVSPVVFLKLSVLKNDSILRNTSVYRLICKIENMAVEECCFSLLHCNVGFCIAKVGSRYKLI